VRGGGAGDLCPKKARARSRPLQSSRTCTSAGASTRPLSTLLELALVADPLRAGLFALIPRDIEGPSRGATVQQCNLFLRKPLGRSLGRAKEGVGNGGRRRLE
ncbi:MAG: hypothetical protein ACPIOQ_80035, partial [Promethearchaeia archaeon]